MSGERGFTSVELIIAMVVSAILIGLVYSVYHSSLRMWKRLEEKLAFESTINTCLERISADLNWIEEIRHEGTACTILVHGGKQTIYQVREGILLRNGYPMNSADFPVSLLNCRIVDFEDGLGIPEDLVISSVPFLHETLSNPSIVHAELTFEKGGVDWRYGLDILPRNAQKSIFKFVLPRD